MYLDNFKFRMWNYKKNKYDYHEKLSQTQFRGYDGYDEIELYIGTKDKNKKEIYVGDIVRFKDRNYLVSLEDIYVGVMIGDKELSDFSMKDIIEFEVIGHHNEYRHIEYEGL